MGSVSDRSNPKYFLPLGLLLSCAIMFVCGLGQGDLRVAGAGRSRCRSLNGWVQGMGWPPCGKTMVHWFSTKERGLRRVVLERRRTTSAAAWWRPSRCSA